MNPRFIKHETKGITYFTFEHFDGTELVTHCFTTRVGGVSQGVYKGMNLGYNSGDESDHIRSNHTLIADVLNVCEKDFVLSNQIHDTRIFHVDAGFKPEADNVLIDGIDGLITHDAGYVLHTVYADCVPLYILDPVRKAIGVAHSGWRGTVGKIGSVLLEQMNQTFGTQAADCLAGIGPSIGPCCFEVGKEVTAAFEAAFDKPSDYLASEGREKDRLNLWLSNQQVLIESGIPENAIICAEMCTCCHDAYFYSYRRDRGETGRMAALMKSNTSSKKSNE